MDVALLIFSSLFFILAACLTIPLLNNQLTFENPTRTRLCFVEAILNVIALFVFLPICEAGVHVPNWMCIILMMGGFLFVFGVYIDTNKGKLLCTVFAPICTALAYVFLYVYCRYMNLSVILF